MKCSGPLHRHLQAHVHILTHIYHQILYNGLNRRLGIVCFQVNFFSFPFLMVNKSHMETKNNNVLVCLSILPNIF